MKHLVAIFILFFCAWFQAQGQAVCDPSNLPALTLTADGAPQCAAAVTLHAHGADMPGTYIWRRDGVIVLGANADTLKAAANGSYTVQFYANSRTGAVSAAVVVAAVANPLKVTLGSDTLLLQGQTLTLRALITGQVGTLAIVWRRDGAILAGQISSELRTDKEGVYTIEVRDRKTNCFVTDEIIVTKENRCPGSAVISFVTDPAILCLQPTLSIRADAKPVNAKQSGTYTYKWTRNGGAHPNQSQFFNGVRTGETYTVEVRDLNNANCGFVMASLEIPAARLTADAGPDMEVCTNTLVTLKSATEVAGITYKWTGPNGFSKTGATVEALATISGAYTLTVSGGTCTSASDQVSINVSNATQQPKLQVFGNKALCLGETAQLDIVNLQSGIYWWYRNGERVMEFVGKTVTVSWEGSYFVEVRSACGEFRSEPVVFTNKFPAAAPKLTNKGKSDLCFQDKTTLEVGAFPGTVSRWQYTSDTCKTWTSIARTEKTLDLTHDGSFAGLRTYRVELVQDGCTTYSTAVSVSFAKAPVGGALSVTGAAQVCQGDATTLRLTGYTGLIARWEFSLDNGLHWTTLAHTADTYTAEHKGGQTGPRQYRVRVGSDPPGCAGAYSSVAAVEFYPTQKPGTITVTGKTQLCNNESALLRLSGHSGTIRRWESSNDGEVTWRPLVGTADTLRVTNDAFLNGTERIRVVFGYPTCPDVAGSPVEILFYADPVPGVVTLDGPAALCVGDTRFMEVTGANATPLRWEYSDNGGALWTRVVRPETTMTVTNTGVFTGDRIYRMIFKTGTCPEFPSATQTLTFQPRPGAVISPEAQDVFPGGTASIQLLQLRGSVVEWQSSPTFSFINPTTISNTNATLSATNVQQTTYYRARLEVTDCGQAFSDIALVRLRTCDVPGQLTVRNVKDGTADVTWTSVTFALNYEVQYRVAGAPSFTSQLVSGTAYQLTGLLPETDYEVQVRSVCDNGVYSGFTALEEFNTGFGTCAHPTNVRTTIIDATTATVVWTDAPRAQYYQVNYRVKGTTGWRSRLISFNSIVLTGLAPGTEYEVRVVTNCGNGNTAPVATAPLISFKTNGTQSCAAPDNVRTSAIANTSVTLQWNTAPAAQSYRVEVSKAGVVVQQVNAPSTTVTLNGLSTGTMYSVRVLSVCSGGDGSFGQPVSFTTTGPSSVCLAPLAVTVMKLHENSIELSWSSPFGAKSYIIKYSVPATGEVNSTTSTDRFFTLTGLLPDTQYDIRITTVCADGPGGESAPRLARTLPLPNCPAPADLVVSDVSTSSAQLTWTGTATEYAVEYRAVGAGMWTTVRTSATMLNLTELPRNTAFEARVRSVCGDLMSGASNTRTFDTGGLMSCITPEFLNVRDQSANTARLLWTPVGAAKHYVVEYRRQGTSNFTSLTTDAIMVELTDLAPNSLYEARVRSVCADGESNFGPLVPFMTLLPSNCLPPIDGTFANLTPTSVFVDWPFVLEAALYVVELKEATATNYTRLETFRDSMTLHNLTPGTSYDIRFRSRCAGGESAPSLVFHFATPSLFICEPARDLKAIVLGQTSARLEWTASAQAQSYRVYWRAAGMLNWTETPAAASPLTLTGLTAGTSYEARLQSRCADGVTSSLTGTVRFTTQNEANCPAPQVVFVQGIGDQFAVLTWPFEPQAGRYRVYYRRVGESLWQSVFSASNTTILQPLARGAQYEAKVASLCGAVESAPTALVHFTTTVTPGYCAVPLELVVDRVGTTQATLRWEAIPEAREYMVSYRKAGGDWTTRIVRENTLTLGLLNETTDYEAQVRTLCANQARSQGTPVLKFRTLAETECTAPDRLTVVETTPTSVTLSWRVISLAFGFPVTYREFDARGYAGPFQTVEANSNLFTITGLLPGRQYEFTVAFRCSGGLVSPASLAVIAQTPALREDLQVTPLAGLTVYPNPNRGHFTVSFTSETAAAVGLRLMDMTGREVYRQSFAAQAGANEAAVSLDNVAAGVYMLETTCAGVRVSTRVVVN